jgi:hypothetical protein
MYKFSLITFQFPLQSSYIQDRFLSIERFEVNEKWQEAVQMVNKIRQGLLMLEYSEEVSLWIS